MTFHDHRTPLPAAVPPAARELPGLALHIVAPGGLVTRAVQAGRGEGIEMARSPRRTIRSRLLAVPGILAAVLAAYTARGVA